MFWNKKKQAKLEARSLSELVRAKEEADTSIVSCTECRHTIRKRDAQLIRTRYQTEVYCPEHRKPYDEKAGFAPIVYWKNKVEVFADGTPVGYVSGKKYHRIYNTLKSIAADNKSLKIVKAEALEAITEGVQANEN